MSETGPERNRGNQKGNDGDRQPNVQRDTARSREVSAGNQSNRRPGAGKSQNQNANGPLSQNRSTPKRGDMTMATAQDENAAVGGFDATAMRASLRKGHDATAEIYKPVEKTTTSRSTAPWASKPNIMANGKDFFLELRRQVAALQQTGGTTLGG